MSDSPQGWQYPQMPSYPQGPVTPGAAAALPRPPAVQRAVILMYVGAAAALVNGIVGGVATHIVVPATSTTSPATAALATADLHNVFLVAAILGGCVGAGLWLWMAWKTASGRSWARVLSTVFFGITCLGVLAGAGAVSSTHAVLPLITSLAEWAVGLVAIIYLWQRDSSNFFAYAGQAKLASAYGGYGYQPPQYGQPGYGQPPQYGQPGYGQPPQYGPPPSDQPPQSGWNV